MTTPPTEPKAQDEETGPHGNESKEQTSPPEHVKNERLMVRWTGTVAFLTGGLVFVGIVTAIIFWKQLNVMQGQLDVMKNTEIVQFRALISEEIEIEQFNGGGVRVVPIFKNSGATQTRDLWAASMTSPIALPNGRIVYLEPPNVATSPHNYFWLGPQQQSRVDGLSGVFDKPVVDEYHARSAQLMFRSLVQYRDISSLHTQRFCFAIWQNRAFFGDDRWAYSQCGDHQNCADEECGEK
jgi:hypothetical protein